MCTINVVEKILIFRFIKISKCIFKLWIKNLGQFSLCRRSPSLIENFNYYDAKVSVEIIVNVRAVVVVDKCDQIGRYLKVLWQPIRLQNQPKNLVTFGLF